MSEVESGLRGGVAFLTRIPLEADEEDWRRFQSFPAAFPIVGYLVGAIAALAFVLLPGVAAAFAYLLVLLGVTGIAHLDGVADVGDAAAVHDVADRFTVMKDTTTGVGGVVGVAVVVAGLALAGLALAGLPIGIAVGLVVAAEVGGKLGMATVACLGTASHDGLGAGFTRNADPPLLIGPALAAVPAALLTGGTLTGLLVGGSLAPTPAVVASLGAVLAGPAVALGALRWADEHLGGVNGDVFGAVNEFGRVLALHVGVVAWTLS